MKDSIYLAYLDGLYDYFIYSDMVIKGALDFPLRYPVSALWDNDKVSDTASLASIARLEKEGYIRSVGEKRTFVAYPMESVYNECGDLKFEDLYAELPIDCIYVKLPPRLKGFYLKLLWAFGKNNPYCCYENIDRDAIRNGLDMDIITFRKYINQLDEAGLAKLWKENGVYTFLISCDGVKIDSLYENIRFSEE